MIPRSMSTEACSVGSFHKEVYCCMLIQSGGMCDAPNRCCTFLTFVQFAELHKNSSCLPIISEEVYLHSGKGNIALPGELYENIRVR